MSKINSFLLYCSGVSLPILKKSPTEYNKYIGIGATVFFTGLFAIIAASYAFLYISDHIIICCLFGLIWGLMIFNLDRLIVGSTRKTNSIRKDSLLVLPRIIMAIFISIVIATPLELKIFEKEIDQELKLINKTYQEQQRANIALEVDSLKRIQGKNIDAIEQQLKDKENIRNKMITIAQEEADGTGGSGQQNLGPIYLIKKLDAETAQKEYSALYKRNKILIDKALLKIDSLGYYQKLAVSHIDTLEADGIASRLVALNNLAQRENIVFIVRLFITLLFIIIELSPILIKLMIERGPYDYILKDFEKRVIKRYKNPIKKKALT